MNLYVGNLYFRIIEEDLYRIFSEYGKVTGVRIIRDPLTRRSKGYGFVEMEHDYEANRAVDNASGLLLEGRSMVVHFAKLPGNSESHDDDNSRKGRIQ